MRRKITNIENIESGADLPQLTDKQYNFVHGILSGKTASDAYRSAYDAENMLPESIWRKASELHSNVNVAAWLSAARRAGVAKASLTLERHLSRLEELAEIAIASGNIGAAVQAEQLRGKASGHYRENIDVNVTDPLAELHALAAISPELATLIAGDKGIPWDEGTKH